ncbi:MAG: leucine-rich repeat protein [Oscillospiraceae bacterium]|nr:leucine-rich repeat protein [Oscillospiraceae bacterium]
MKFRKLMSLFLAVTITASVVTEAAADGIQNAKLSDFTRSEESSDEETVNLEVTQKCLSAGNTIISNGLLFTETEDGTYEVGYNTGDKKPEGSVTIPETVNRKRVTRIAEAGFLNCDKLTEVIVPDSVTSAGAFAFEGTPYLNNQDGPVKYAGKVAVYCDPNAENVTVKDGTLGLADKLFNLVEGLKTAVLPQSLVNLGFMTFNDCDKLTSVNLPENLTIIGSGVFAGCSALSEVVIPDTVTNIGAYAFADTGITSVTIPESVTQIGKGAFENSALGTSSVNMGNGYVNIGGRAFGNTVFYSAQKNVKYAGSVIIGCDENITDISIKPGTTAIADMAFSNCGKLKTVTIPDSVQTIGSDAFFSCSSLESVIIPKNVVSIGEDAFRLCESLTSVSLPLSLKTIGLGAFYGCDNLKTVNYAGSAADWAKLKISGENTPFLKVKPTLSKDPKTPDAVTGVKATSTADSITLTWNASAISTGYQVNIYKDGKWTAAGKTNAKTTSFTVKNLSPGTEYQFRVYSLAYNIYSPKTAVKANTKPSPVTELKASPSSDSVKLTWNKSANADSYQVNIYKDEKWTMLGKTDGSTTSFTVNGLSPATTYQFRVYALFNNVYSTAVSTKVTTKPAAVTGLKASVASNSIKLSWNKSASADSYQVNIYKDGKWTKVGKTDSSTTSFTVSGLSPSTTYQFRVYSLYNNIYSAAVSLKATTKLAAVTGLKVSSSTANSIKLTWNKNANADSYQVDVYKNGKWTYLAKVTGTSYTASKLSANTTYSFRVFAFKGNTYSSSISIKATTKKLNTPDPVTGLKASATTNSIKLTWNKSAIADSYQIDIYKNGKWVYLAKVTGTSYTASNLSANTTYSFRVFAFKGKTYSTSAKINATTKSTAKPAAVTGLTASATTNSIKLTWNKSAIADSYQIDIYKNGKWTYLAKITGTSYTASNLSVNTTYSFRVFAFNGNLYSSSAKVNATTKTTVQTRTANTSQYSAAVKAAEQIVTTTVTPAVLPGANIMLKGIDVSGWQGEIDFRKVKASGVDFVIVKAGYSTSTVDTWETNYKNAKDAGLMVGAYWYSTATTLEDGKKEALAFINAMKGKQFEFPVYFDVEEPDQFDLGKEFCTQLVETFCGELEKAGYMAGVYCSTYWYTYFVDESVRLKRPAFIADYRGRCYYKASYGIWQHGYGNNVPGINANCDLDWGYVDYSQYIKANHLNGF